MDKTDETQFDKNEGNQLVINSNTGTINITNHIKCDTKAIESWLEKEKLQSQVFGDFIKSASGIAKDFIEHSRSEKAEASEKTKKNTRKQ